MSSVVKTESEWSRTLHAARLADSRRNQGMELTEPEEDLANTDSVGTLTLGRGQRGHLC